MRQGELFLTGLRDFGMDWEDPTTLEQLRRTGGMGGWLLGVLWFLEGIPKDHLAGVCGDA